MPSRDQNIRNAGLKVTLPRVKVLKVLEEAATKGQHLSAEGVYKQLLKDGEDVGLATIYRVLTQFEASHLVKRHNFASGHAVFEMAEGDHHDHMVCVETGRIVEFCNDQIEELQETIAKEHGYQLVDHSLVLYVRPVE